MQTIDSGLCRTPGGGAAAQASATQAFNFKSSRGSLDDRADQLVRATVLADLGQSVGGGHGRHGHASIQRVAAAIGKALSGQDVTGTDAADDVLKQIETSLHKAAQALADRGVDARTIDATIDRFRSQLANALDALTQGATGASGSANNGAAGSAGSVSGSGGAGSSSGSGSSSGVGSSSSAGGASGSGGTSASGGAASGGSTSGVGASATSVTSVSKFVSREVRKERGAIDLVTAEGDRVSIRFRSKEVVTGSATQATASDGSTTTASKTSVFSRGGMKIEVDGDLNEDELAAIGDLLGKVDDIATQFFSGDVQAAFGAASSIGVDSDQIAAYRLNLTYSRKVATAYGAWGAGAPATTQPPAAAGDGTTPGSGASPGSSTSAPATTDGVPTTSDSSAGSANDSAGAPANGTATAGSSDTSDATASPTDGATGAPDSGPTPPATTAPATPPASPRQTILSFISDALSKLSTANGSGRLSFSMNWKMSVLVTAIQSAQPAQPTTPADQTAAANTQLLGDSLQKIAAA